jgi:hypothetical protein
LLDNFRTITEDNFKFSDIRGHLAPRFRASEIVNFLLIDINLEGLLDACSAVNVSAVSQGVATFRNHVTQAYLALRLFYFKFPE